MKLLTIPFWLPKSTKVSFLSTFFFIWSDEILLESNQSEDACANASKKLHSALQIHKTIETNHQFARDQTQSALTKQSQTLQLQVMTPFPNYSVLTSCRAKNALDSSPTIHHTSKTVLLFCSPNFLCGNSTILLAPRPKKRPFWFPPNPTKTRNVRSWCASIWASMRSSHKQIRFHLHSPTAKQLCSTHPMRPPLPPNPRHSQSNQFHRSHSHFPKLQRLPNFVSLPLIFSPKSPSIWRMSRNWNLIPKLTKKTVITIPKLPKHNTIGSKFISSYYYTYPFMFKKD